MLPLKAATKTKLFNKHRMPPRGKWLNIGGFFYRVLPMKITEGTHPPRLRVLAPTVYRSGAVISSRKNCHISLTLQNVLLSNRNHNQVKF